MASSGEVADHSQLNTPHLTAAKNVKEGERSSLKPAFTLYTLGTCRNMVEARVTARSESLHSVCRTCMSMSVRHFGHATTAAPPKPRAEL